MRTPISCSGRASKLTRLVLCVLVATPACLLTVGAFPSTSNASLMTSQDFSFLGSDGSGVMIVSDSLTPSSRTLCTHSICQTAVGSPTTLTCPCSQTTVQALCSPNQTGHHNSTQTINNHWYPGRGIGRLSDREHRFPIIRWIITRRLANRHEDVHDDH